MKPMTRRPLSFSLFLLLTSLSGCDLFDFGTELEVSCITVGITEEERNEICGTASDISDDCAGESTSFCESLDEFQADCLDSRQPCDELYNFTIACDLAGMDADTCDELSDAADTCLEFQAASECDRE